MSNQRLGKRERALIKLASDLNKRQSPRTYGADLTEPWMRSPSGSVNGARSLMGATHSNFRGQGAAYETKVIYHGPVTLGRVAGHTGWKAHDPLPTDHTLLRSLERGDKVPVGNEPSPRLFYPTSKAEKRFGKTK